MGYARVRASRITYVGELGWELYIPTEFAQSVYGEIVRVGARHGLGLAGYQAMNSLRMEKAFKLGRDGIEPSTSGLKVRCSTD